MQRFRIAFLCIIDAFLILICTACDQEKSINEPVEEPDPNIFTYYWDEGWIEHAKWKTTIMGSELTIRIEAWNDQPQFSTFNVKFDNIVAYWNIDSVSRDGGVLEDFNDGKINGIWNKIESQNAVVNESNGVLNVDIPEGKPTNGACEVGGVITKDYIINGDFDIQVDFILNPEYHSTPNCNTKLFLTDNSGNNIEISIRDQHYLSLELPYNGPANIKNPWTQTDHLSGKLRIVRNDH